MIEFELPYDPNEFDPARCVTCGQTFRWHQTSDGTWIGMDGSDEYNVDIGQTLKIRSSGSQKDFESLFRLDENRTEIAAELQQKAPELRDALALLPGLRVMRCSDPVETLFSFLCTSNNHLSRISGMVGFLAARGTPRLSGLHRFPTLEALAEIREQELRSAGFGYRGRTIPMVAQEILRYGGMNWLQALKSQPYREATRALITLPGVGPKLADCVALYGLDHGEAAPIDTHLWQALTRHYFPEWQGTNLTDKKYQIAGDWMRERFGKHAGWAHQLLYFENLLTWRDRCSKNGR